MVIMFLNCANRKIADAINDYVVSSDCTIDVIILAEAKNISSIEGFKFSFMSEYKFGLHIFF